MQHGSILIEHDPGILSDILHSRKSKEALRTEIHSTTTSINHHLSEPIDFLSLKEIVLQSFTHTLGICLRKGSLTNYEVMLKEQLLRNKYQKSEWNLHRGSSYTSIKTDIAAFQ